MKNLFVSALLLTGLIATAQEPVKKEIKTTTQSTTTAKPATDTTATAAPAQTTVKTEATTKEEKAVPKKAEPAKKSK